MTRQGLHERLGRRGEFLATAGTVVALIGYGYVIAPPIRRPDQFVVHDLIPPPFWGAAWVTTGLLAVAFAFTTKPGRDRLGFAFCIVMPAMQAASFAISWGLIQIGHPGDARGIFSALSWAGMARFIAIVAAWPEPRKRLPELPKTTGGG